ncbi:MAG TPA: AAA family ATPase [Desulfitobacterium dehalogenans]|uniref:Nuclease SbcCD subunit C n=1 Tax=Desulfitobacterium dehalogenans TaxID=36854 RepID=A0A7C7D9F9_9FIRM|nr:AAA family ATPase [Desulfitobacterium dehalogenans]
MIITKVKIFNFKIFKSEEFDFGENKMILLTGANGFGKTTIIDAIEWCLTGDISRLKNSYEERNSTQAEKGRADNKKGIIKNNSCLSNDKIKVVITLKVGETEINIFREQLEDDLYASTKLEFIEDVPQELKDKIKEYTSKDKFYSYHICDINKSQNFLNSDRQEIKKKFQDFIKPHPLADSLSMKLDEFQNKVSEKIVELKEKKSKQESIITTMKADIDTLKADLKTLDYPQVRFFDEENLVVVKENIDKIIEQLNKIKLSGYITINSKVNDAIDYFENKQKTKKINELITMIEEKQEYINISIKNNYYDYERIEKIDIDIKNVSNKQHQIENAKNISDIDKLIDSDYYIEINDEISKYKNKIMKIVEELNSLRSEINQREKGNEIITALSNLVVSKEGIFKYKNEENRLKCPLCGSEERFSKISAMSELAIEAETYLNQNQADLVNKKEKEKETQKKLNSSFEQFKQFIIEQLSSKLTLYQNEKALFTSCHESTQEFFSKLKELKIPINEEYKNELLKKRVDLKIVNYDEGMYNSDLDLVRKVLTVLEYETNLSEFTIEKLKRIQLDMKQLCKEVFDVYNFSFEKFHKKILFVNNILNNNKISEKEKLLKEYSDKDISIDLELQRLEKLKVRAKELRSEIETKKTDIEKLELEAVGPYLYKIFSKVIRHTKITKFNFKRDSSSRGPGGATLSDQNANNILNILSQGQLGVLVLSYFFANMFKRKSETNFKSYFVDDITNCMDDMNVLTFVDIIKYQLYQKEGVINQLFFSTCDDDLEELIKHKMESFGIGWINFKFNSYAQGSRLEKTGINQRFGYLD